MGILDIESEIKKLPAEKVGELMSWLAAYHAELWEKQIASDLGSGRLDALLGEVGSEIESGLAEPI